MSDSVAGQIRIDLLANPEKFSAGMRAGTQEARNFSDECDKIDKKLARLHAGEDYAKRQQAAWQSAMTGSPLRSESPLHVGDGYQEHIDAALSTQQRNYQRWDALMRRQREKSPFGQTSVVDMSRGGGMVSGAIRGQGASIAGEITAVEATISGRSKTLQRTIASIFGRGAARPFKIFNNVSGLAGELGLVNASVLGLGAAFVLAANRAAAMGEEINKTREEAIKAGMSYDDYVKKQGLPEHSRFIEGSALTADAVAKNSTIGGLIAHPLNTLGSWGTGAWGGMVNAADWVFGGAPSLSGHGGQYAGVGAMADYARIEDEQKRHTAEVNARNKIDFSTIDEMKRKYEAVGKTAEQIARDDYINKVHPDAGRLAVYDEWAEKLRKVNAEAAAVKIGHELDLQGMSPENRQRAEFQDKLKAAGLSPNGLDDSAKNYWQLMDRFGSNQLDASKKSLIKETPEETYSKEIAQANNLFSHQKINAEQLATFKREKLEEYYQAVDGFDAKELRKRLKSAGEEYDQKLQDWRKVAKTPEERRQGEGVLQSDYLKKMGIDNPLGDYEEDLEKHRKDLREGRLTQGQFSDWNRKRTKTAVSQISSDMDFHTQASPMAAMAAGSAAAYSTVVKANMTDPKVKIMTDIQSTLNGLAKGILTKEAADALIEKLKNSLNGR